MAYHNLALPFCKWQKNVSWRINDNCYTAAVSVFVMTVLKTVKIDTEGSIGIFETYSA